MQDIFTIDGRKRPNLEKIKASRWYQSKVTYSANLTTMRNILIECSQKESGSKREWY